MRNQEVKYVTGYVHIKIIGKQPEFFLQHCMDKDIVIWDIEKLQDDCIKGVIYVSDLNKLEHYAEHMLYGLEVKDPKGFVPTIRKVWKRKLIIYSIVLCTLIVFILSNILWKLEVNGVSIEIDKKIREQLALEGLYEGAWTNNVTDLNSIQQSLLSHIPELMYIGIEKKGTTYHVDAIEKLQEKKSTALTKQHLVASKAGVIEKIFVQKGISLVNVHDIVNKGDMLVSGIIDVNDEQDKRNKDENKRISVSAEGKIFANTWYEINMTSPLYTTYKKLTGDNYDSYELELSQLSVPIWGFRNPFSDYIVNEKEYPLQIFQKRLPITFIKKSFYNQTTIKQSKTKQEAKEIAINYIKKQLQLNLGTDANILDYKVLHESEENGKVNMNLYISVLEDIAKEKAVNEETFNIKGSNHE